MIDWSTWIPTTYLISEWSIRIGMTPIVLHRRRPANALSWLAIIFFMPWIGLLLYSLIGQRYLGRKRIERYSEARRLVETPARMATQDPHITHPIVAPEQDDLVMLCERLSGLPIVGGNTVDLLTETDQFTTRLIEDIDAAQHHAHFDFYIFRADETGRRVAEAISRAAKRGVTCRIVADSVGSKDLFAKLAASLRRNGVDVREALPAGLFRRWFRRLDLRNHRKIAVIDGAIAYTGSQNIVNAHYGHSKVGEWRDMMMRIAGPAALSLQIVFLEDWCAETGTIPDDPELFPQPDASGTIPIQIVPSGPNDPSEVFRSLTIAAINEAQRRVILTTPYFIPEETLVLALRLAALRGVRVDLVLPERSDQRIVGAAAKSFYGQLLECGVHIHLHSEGLLHAKTLSVDSAFALIGSGNLDSRSFFLNFEVSALLYGAEITDRLREHQERYMKQSRQLSEREWRQEPRLRTFGRNLAALMSPLL